MTVASPPAPAPAPRPPAPAARRIGYLVAAAVSAALLGAANLWPGWDVVPFLTSDIEQVIRAVNVSLVTVLLVNLVYLGHDPRWVRGLGAMIMCGLSLVALLQLWQVFPFYFSSNGLGWALLVRVLLIAGVVGTAIGCVAEPVALARHAAPGLGLRSRRTVSLRP